MINDRAAVVATSLIGVFRRALSDPGLQREIAELLRQEFRDIRQEALAETRYDPE
jgi:hypothetical protein